MPLTGFELFANDVCITESTGDSFVVDFPSGERGVTLRMSRATFTKLVGLGSAVLKETENDAADIINMARGL